MRISDWSSDVFSSDLTALLCLTNEADALQGLRPVEPVAGVALRIRHDQPFLLVVAQGLGAYGGEAGQFADREHDDLDRSEEHTSELQSLMRISYAVFGLKKKNK